MTIMARASSKSPKVNPGPIPILFSKGRILSFTVSLFSRSKPPAIIKPSPSTYVKNKKKNIT
jgi:hypothetical protein